MWGDFDRERNGECQENGVTNVRRTTEGRGSREERLREEVRGGGRLREEVRGKREDERGRGGMKKFEFRMKNWGTTGGF
jgi:hypothetical protein